MIWCLALASSLIPPSGGPSGFGGSEREQRFGVVLVGVAEDKTSVRRRWREGGSDSHPRVVG